MLMQLQRVLARICFGKLQPLYIYVCAGQILLYTVAAAVKM
eukprot:COSAG06_NODE_6676_length_2830_cov_2.413036_2_plen_41_part_00